VNADLLLRKADEMAENARVLRQLAGQVAELTEPLGHQVISLAIRLKRHGLCIVHRDVLSTAAAFIESSDADEADHPREVARRQQSLLKSIDQALHPERLERETKEPANV
jgi:hypothetical protein